MPSQLSIEDIKDLSLNKVSQFSRDIIPALQRGLVWKPRQVEFLWDSILRAFPIGSFIFSESEKNSLYLIDGQQRYDAISTGYDFPFGNEDAEPPSILWIDIAPASPDYSTRKYWVRLTTRSHPWGYNPDENCTPLSAGERRDALKTFGYEGCNIYKDTISLQHTWPFKSKLPIPLSVLLTSIGEQDSKEAYCNKVMAQLEKIPGKWKENFYTGQTELLREKIEAHFDVLHTLPHYRITTLLLSWDIISGEDKNTQDTEVSCIEILFARLGTGGTPISNADLIYSAIKAYWEEIKDANDELAARYMPPTQLVMLVFRLALTRIEKPQEGFRSELSIKQVRELTKQDEIKNKIVSYYQKEEGLSRLSKILEQVDSWISGDDLPQILRVEIARNAPDLYLLLMYLADLELDSEVIPEARFLRALCFYIAWFNRGTKRMKNCIKTIYCAINSGKPSPEAIKEALYQCIWEEDTLPIFPLTEINEKVQAIKEDCKETWRFRDTFPKYHLDFWDTLCGNRSILLFAQGAYLKQKFPHYDPAKTGMWEEQNRPWDIDHIIPQDWMYRKRGKWSEFCKSILNSNGNFAAIPFETNRSKSSSANWDEYEKYKDDLLFDSDFCKIKTDITNNQTEARLFSSLVAKRTVKIYEKCYATLKELNLEDTDFGEGSILSERKKAMELIQQEIESAEVYFVWGDNEYKITAPNHWSRKWLSAGVVFEEKGLYPAIATSNGKEYEVGFRKMPGHSQVEHRNKNIIQNIIKENDLAGEGGEWWLGIKTGNNLETAIEILKKIIADTRTVL